jgi:hypothetical protein
MRWVRGLFAATMLIGIFSGCASENAISVAGVQCSGLANLKLMITEVEARKGSNLLIEQQYPDDGDTVWRKLLWCWACRFL